MLVKVKGIHKIRKKLAGGSVKVYHYAWRGGPCLEGKPGSAEYLASYNAAIADLKKPAQGLLSTLVAEWRTSAEYRALAPSSKRNYEMHISSILSKFGSMPIAALDDPRTRGLFKAWRDGMADTPRKADYAVTTLTRVLNVALDNGRIRFNHAARIARLYSSDRAEKVWTEENVGMFMAQAPAPLALALLLALSTGQRQGDLLKLTWSAYDGKSVRLEVGKRQRGKPRVWLVVPLLKEACDALDALDRTSTHILTNIDGLPWTSSGFRSSWGKAFRKIFGDMDLNFHDLRGTAVTRLKIANCSDSEIASITGHSEKTVGAILRAHYLGDQTPLAERAIRRLNRNRTGRKTVNRL